MIYVLIGAAVLTTVMGHLIDTVVIAAVVITNALIGYIQEGKAADALEGIRSMLSLEAQARRDGTWTTVAAEELVPGEDRKSTRLNSSHVAISYAVFCL